MAENDLTPEERHAERVTGATKVYEKTVEHLAKNTTTKGRASSPAKRDRQTLQLDRIVLRHPEIDPDRHEQLVSRRQAQIREKQEYRRHGL